MWRRALRPSAGCQALGGRETLARPWAAPQLVAARGFSDEDVPQHHTRYPKKYFDFKAFRETLRDKKESLSEAEMREVRREYAPPPPEGWTVREFLEQMSFGEGYEDVADLFEEWKDFISMSPKDIQRIPDVSVAQRRKLGRYITLFCHGLWPKVSTDEFYGRFGGAKLAREGKAWTPEEDDRLLELARLYDVTFGDPWLYLSWDMQRREVDVRDRYVEIAVKPRERADRCELGITKSSRPLHMHRRFRIIPADLYVVPSGDNFRLAEEKFEVPAAFRKYRQDEIF